MAQATSEAIANLRWYVRSAHTAETVSSWWVMVSCNRVNGQWKTEEERGRGGEGQREDYSPEYAFSAIVMTPGS